VVRAVVRLVELCEQLEGVVESPDSISETLRDDVAHAWDNASASVNKDALAKLTNRRDIALKHLDAGTQYDYDANEAERRQLLIQMEILTDDKRAELAKLVSAWYAAAPSNQQSKGSLHTRFLKATNQ